MFGKSSSGIYLSGTTLHASCLDSNGGSHNSSLNLNPLIGNHEGTLVWGSSNFAASCNNISLSGTTLHADCMDSNGKCHHSTLDLNNYVSNIEGTLKA